jgi:tRNA threonylcarbamoyladenosine modification (KEOPS) complex  Pcc1 subunit
MKYSVVVNIKEDVENVYKCMLTEISERERSLFTIKKDNDRLEFHIEAKDATALRATLSAITQLLSVYEKMGEIK